MNPSTSQMSTDFSYVSTLNPEEELILYADSKTKKLVKYHSSEVKTGVTDLRKLFELHELITQLWFQDNTLLFDKLLNDRNNLVMCIYPPGSGKSTMAMLFTYYLSKNGMPEEIRTFLDACQFQKTEDTRAQNDSSYRKFRGCSSFVLFMDYNNVGGEKRLELESRYASYMLSCWESCGISNEIVNDEKQLLRKEASCIWTSLSRLRDEISYFNGENLYIILDSLDTMYSLIANLPVVDGQALYNKFTKSVVNIIDNNDPRIRTFIFGVSPYLIYEFLFKKISASFYFIGDEENSVGQFFSYSDASIAHVIKEWKLDISIDDCKLLSKFEFNSNVFINPYLCVSYLRSLEKKGALYRVNLSPRSLWMKCIFEEEDLAILYEVLSGESKRKFAMAVTVYKMSILSKNSKDRKLYYPLFVFGGFLSCKKETENDDIYTLYASNESVKVLLHHHLEILHFKRFKVTVSECLSLFNQYLDGNFDSYCKNLSQCIGTMSSNMIKEEKPYHTFMVGIIAPLKLSGYDIEHDKEYGLIKPDSFIKKGNRIILIEYKNVIPSDFTPKKARLAVGDLEGDAHGKILDEFYAPLLESVSKSVIIKLCQKTVSEARLHQLSRYAPDFASQFQQDVEVNLMLFYLNHVILLNSKYFYKTKTFSKYEIFSSDGYFDDKDLKLILNAK